MTFSPTIVISARPQRAADELPCRLGHVDIPALADPMARLWQRSWRVRASARHEHVIMVQPRRGAGQDRAVVVPCRRGLVVVVADGAGGSAGGAEAANLVLERVRETPPLTSSACVELLTELDDEIRRHPRAGETTAVVAHVDGSRISGASVGDSVAWAIDHREARDLTARQHRKPLLGYGNVKPVPFDVVLGVCTLLVATDGLYIYASTAAIVEAAGSAALEDAARKLIALPRLSNGEISDDIAVVLVRVISRA